MNDLPMPGSEILERLRTGCVIPAHPLALDGGRRMDERRQRALTRYYLAAGAGGVAVGVHSTQFEIRKPGVGLLRPVLELASEVLEREGAGRAMRVAGICGDTRQAVAEAEMARELGCDLALLSLAALIDHPDEELVAHARSVSEVLPLFGFYLQTAVGGRVLSHDFWRAFVEIPNVCAIKAAPFNRYQTLDVVRAIAAAGREDEVMLYTGNDDHVVGDLVTRYRVAGPHGKVELHFRGGLLGHWAFWTRRAVEMLETVRRHDGVIDEELKVLANETTDANAAIFDAVNGYAGCIPGIHEVFRRQGLLQRIDTLNPNAALSPGQSEEIDRTYRDYPHLNDDDFVKANLDSWLR